MNVFFFRNNLLNRKTEEIYTSDDKDRFGDHSLNDQRILIELLALKWDSLVVSERSPAYKSAINPFKGTKRMLVIL